MAASKALSLCFLSLCLLLPVYSLNVPAFVLSDSTYVNSKNGVIYQSLSTEDLSRTLFKALTSTNSDEDLVFSFSGKNNPELLLAIISNVMRSEHVTLYGLSETSNSVQVFQKLIASSNSSVSIPYVDSELNPTKLSTALLNSAKEFSSLSNVAVLGTCQLNNPEIKQLNSVSEIEDHLDSLKGNNAEKKVNVLMFCASDSSSPSSFDALMEETDQMEAVVSIVKSHSPNFVTLLTSDASYHHHIQQSHQRRIMKVGAASGINTTLCDTSCQFKADILEATLVILVFIIILISGLCCMMGIETPTKFELAKDA